jgi:hypothetical protein
MKFINALCGRCELNGLFAGLVSLPASRIIEYLI